ncbi:transposase [Vibrio parahaemolyticus]|nr:transposase [Vibrio parahaemolyticus]
MDEQEIKEGKQSKQNKCGRPRYFCDLASTIVLKMKYIFSMPFRTLQGLSNSLLTIALVPLQCLH